MNDSKLPDDLPAAFGTAEPQLPLYADLYEGKTARQWHDAWLLEYNGRLQDKREWNGDEDALLRNLADESDQCRNDGVTDIADLLDEAIRAIKTLRFQQRKVSEIK